MADKKSKKSGKEAPLKSKRLNAEEAGQVKGGLAGSANLAYKEGPLSVQSTSLRGISDKL